MERSIKINTKDNVAVALVPLSAGEQLLVDGQAVTLATDVPQGHKFLLEDLEAGAQVIKYGYPIGHLREAKTRGSWVDHRHIATNLSGLLSYNYSPVYTADDLRSGADASVDYNCAGLPTAFLGYHRGGGEVGIRNEVWIVPTVGCVNGIVQEMARQLRQWHPHGLHIAAFPHNYGCSQLSEDHENTRRILRDLCLHPNAGAVLVVGLGCENNQPEAFMETLGDYDRQRVRLLICQQVEGAEVEAGLEILEDLYSIAEQDQRTPTPLSALRVGLKCGGSDGLSGITANPLLGVFSDYLVSRGGTTVLTEVPEMFGAETILMNRCATEQLFNQTVRMVNDFKQYFLSHGEPVGENPSPGNKAGGISTLEDKALGCTQKCGRSSVRGVLSYGERLCAKGLNLLSAPGNDLVASTALAAAGCHMVLFTTGRGTPFGTFVPTLKVSTNSPLYQRKPHWIDFNAGQLTEDKTMEQVFRDFTERVIAIANGELTHNERNGYQEIAIFKNGVTL